jgi:hypothetical protein
MGVFRTCDSRRPVRNGPSEVKIPNNHMGTVYLHILFIHKIASYPHYLDSGVMCEMTQQSPYIPHHRY